jgi:hypothetical protein
MANEQAAHLFDLIRRHDPVRILGGLLESVVDTRHPARDREANARRPQFDAERVQEIERGLHENLDPGVPDPDAIETALMTDRRINEPTPDRTGGSSAAWFRTAMKVHSL